jgi:hypothetical protein
MIQDSDTPPIHAPHNLLAGARSGPGRDDLLEALRLCFQGERVFTSDLRQEISARGLDLESLASSEPLPVQV